MTEKISDERLKCFVQGVDLENITPNDEISMAVELLSLRSLNKRLVEDGERLAKNLTSWCEVYQLWGLDSEALEAHTALMKEIGG